MNSSTSNVTNNGLIIRNARPDELDAAAQLLKAAYQQYCSSVPAGVWDTYVANIMDVRSRLDHSELLVAEIEGKLAGTVTLYLKASDSAAEGWPENWAGIRLLGVHPDYRNRGIAQALVEECLNRAHRQGIHTIGLRTTPVMTTAHRLYERMGFERVPEHDFHPSPRLNVMAYRLDI